MTTRAASLQGQKESGIKKNVIDNLTVQYKQQSSIEMPLYLH